MEFHLGNFKVKLAVVMSTEPQGIEIRALKQSEAGQFHRKSSCHRFHTQMVFPLPANTISFFKVFQGIPILSVKGPFFWGGVLSVFLTLPS